MSNVIRRYAIIGVILLLSSCKGFSEPGTAIQYSVADIQFDTTVIDTTVYDVIGLPNTIPPIDGFGKPQLPMRQVYVVFPRDEMVDSVRIVSTSVETLDGTYYVYPVQQPVPIGDTAFLFTSPDSSIYTSTEPYPSDLVEFTGDGYMSGYHIARTVVHPLRYVPADRKLLLHTSIDLVLSTSSGIDRSFPIYRMSNRSTELFKQLAKLLVDNPEDVDIFFPLQKTGKENHSEKLRTLELPLPDGVYPDYVVVTSEELAPSFESLKQWKTAKGIPSAIVTVEWIDANYPGCDKAEKIRNFIKDAKSNWGTTWVLLGGDTPMVPARMAWAADYRPFDNWHPADLYFSDLNSNWNEDGDTVFGEVDDNVDMYPDVFVGRAPVSNADQAGLFVSKVLEYEREITRTDYQAKFMLSSMNLGGAGHGVTGYCIPIEQEIPGHFSKTTRYSDYMGQDEAKVDLITGSLNRGQGFVSMVFHGSEPGLGFNVKDGTIWRRNLDFLSNWSRYGIYYVCSCWLTAFDYNCAAEHAMLGSTGGAVAWMGNARLGWMHQIDIDKMFFVNVFQNEIYSVGAAFASAKQSQLHQRPLQYNLTLLGDPEMPVWTGEPKEFASTDISYPSSLDVGDQDVTITVTDGVNVIEGALVCLMKGEEAYASGETSTSGEVMFYSFRPESDGEAALTVTVQDFIPFETTIPVTQGTEPYVCHHSHTVNDDVYGNGDGTANPGERLELEVKVKNTGPVQADNVWVTLGLVNHYADILGPDRKHFGDIGPGETSQNSYDVRILTENPDVARIPFDLTIESVPYSWRDAMQLEVRLDLLEHVGHTVYPSLDRLCMREIEITNYGFGTADDVEFSLKDKYGVVWGPVSVGDIAPRSSAVTPERLEFEPTTPIDQYEVVMRDKYGREWEQSVELYADSPYRPSDLNPPDATWSSLLGQDFIELAWRYGGGIPDIIAGYNVYRSPTSGGTYSRINSLLVKGTCTLRDEELSPYTDYYYRIEAVDESANKSELSTPFRMRTNPPYQEDQWPVSVVPGGPGSCVVGNLDADPWKYLETVVTVKDLLYVIGHDGVCINAVSGGNWRVPVLADVLGDSKLEIIVQHGGHLSVLEHNGTPIHWLTYINSPYHPVVQDINLDDEPEIIVSVKDGTNYSVNVFKGDLSTVPPWPWQSPYEIICAPAVGDVDSDGELEAVVATRNISTNTLRVYAVKDGGLMPGWTVSPYVLPWVFESSVVLGDIIPGSPGLEIAAVVTRVCNPGETPRSVVMLIDAAGDFVTGWPVTVDYTLNPLTLADIDGNGDLEVVGTTWHRAWQPSRLYVWDHDGLLHDSKDFPQGWCLSPSSVGDVNGDGMQEIVVSMGAYGREVCALNSSSLEPILGFPISLEGPTTSQPVLTNLGPVVINGAIRSVDIVVGGTDKRLHAFNLPYAYDPDKIEWGQFAHDMWNTNCYETDLRIGLSGHITEDTRWNRNAQVTVIGDITVDSGVILTIESGVRVRFAPQQDNQNSGTDPGRCELVVDGGTLVASGTRSEPVAFTSDNNGDWYGIRFENASVGSLVYCDIEYAEKAIESSGDLRVEGCDILNNVVGIEVDGGSIVARVNRIIENDSIGVLTHIGQGTNFGDLSNADTTDDGANRIWGNGIWDAYNASPNTPLMQGNCWYSCNSNEIDARIYDNDENGGSGAVDFGDFYFWGSIDTDITWSGLVSVGGDVSVPILKNLIILPGTKIRFAAGLDMEEAGIDPALSELVIEGSFDASGTSNEPILFTSDALERLAGDWHGIALNQPTIGAPRHYERPEFALTGLDLQIDNLSILPDRNRQVKARREENRKTLGSVDLEWLVIEYATQGISYCKRGIENLNYSEVRDCSDIGVRVEGENVFLMMDHTDVKRVPVGISCRYDGKVWVENSEITECSTTGIVFAGPYGLVDQTIVENCGTGIWTEHIYGPSIEYSDIMNNEIGVHSAGSSAPGIQRTKILNNSLYGVYITDDARPDLGQFCGYNDLYGNPFNVWNGTDNQILARYNYWGTTNLDTIAAHIWDHNDDPALGVVVFQPIRSNPSASGSSGATCNAEMIPLTFKLYQNAPNPFTKNTTIRYSVPRNEKVSLSVYDASGRCVKTLVNAEKKPGYHNVSFDGRRLGTGVYFTRFVAGDYKEVGKLILVR